MVAIVTGAGLGLDRSSGWVLGSLGQLGNAAFGRFGENVTVNAANGNLIIGRTDEILIGLGPDDALSRSYNSESANQGYGSQNDWQTNDSRCITGLTGTVNTTGSTVTRIDSDGSDTLYNWNSTLSAYVSTQGGEADHRLTYSGTLHLWTWVDGRSGAKETYDAVNSGRIKTSADADGNTLTFSYNGSGQLSQVQTTDNGSTHETTALQYTGSNLTSVVTTAYVRNSDGTVSSTQYTLTRVYYTYDSSNRLSTVTTDLTPTDNSISDGNKVVTTYGYDGASNRVASISQTGGAQLNITYDSSHRVSSLQQTIAGSVTRTTSFSYYSGYTTVTDSNGQNTTLTYDTSGQLTQLTLPVAQSGASAQVLNFTYNSDGDVLTAEDANGNTTTYTYDANDNLTSITDPLGNAVTRTYDTNNHVVTETRTPASGSAYTVRYAYNTTGHLAYIVNGDGGVTEYDYNSSGQLTSTIVYRDSTYNLSGLTSTNTISDSTLVSWASGLATAGSLATIERTDYAYDFRGNLYTAKTYSACSTAGVGSTSSPYTTVTYIYDQAGMLLQKQTSGISNTEVYTYDGLWRMTSAVDLNSGTTTIAYTDSTNTVAVTMADGLVKTSVYDAAAELVSYTESGTGMTTAVTTYTYDDLGQLSVVTDPTSNKSYFLYDNVGRKVADIAADGSMTEYRYDANNNLIATIGYANKTTYSLSSLVNSSGVGTNPAESSVRPSTSTSDVWNWQIYDHDNRLIETINGDGGVTTFAYDGFSNLTQTYSYANVLSSSTITGYQTTPPAQGSLSTPTAYSGHDRVTRNFYDNEGRLIGSLSADGDLSQIVYNWANEKTQTINYATQVSSGHMSDSWSSLLTDVGTTSSDIHNYFFYDGRGQLAYTLDANLRPTEFDYDAAGNLLTKIEYGGSIASTSTYTIAYIQSQITSLGLATNANDRRTWYVYDSATGNLDYSIDAMGDVTQFKYDTMGRVVKETQFATTDAVTTSPSQSTMDTWAGAHSTSSDRISRTVYDIAGKVIYTVDPLGYVMQNNYDAAGRVTLRVQYASQYTVTDSVTQSSLAAQLPGTIPSSAVQSAYSYDADGRVTDTINDYGGIAVDTRIVYDALGRVSQKIAAYGSSIPVTTQYNYDTDNRLLSVVQDYGTGKIQATTSYTYDGLGNVATKTDPDGNVTHYAYDALGNVLTTTDALSNVTTNVYDAFGNVVKTTDALGNSSYFYYDLLDRLTLQIDRLGYATATTYTIGNEVLTVEHYATATTGAGIGSPPSITLNSAQDATTTFTRDLDGRLTQITDALGNTQVFTLDAFGDQLHVQNQLGGVTVNTFDQRGMLLSQTLPDSIVNTFAYDARGNLITKVEASGLAEQRTTNYVYDNLNRLTQTTGDQVQVTATDLKTVTTITPTTTYTYDLRNNLIEVVDPSGAKTFNYYDDLNRKIATLNAVGTYAAMAYDAVGNMTSLTAYATQVTLPSSPGGTPPNPGGTNRQTAFTYDADNRLYQTTVASVLTWQNGSSAYSGTTGNVTTTNTYDALGNIIKQTDGNGNSIYTYYDQLGRKIEQADQDKYLTTWTLDQNGNVLTETRYANQYTGSISTSSVPSPTANSTYDRTTTFTYDKNGNRQTETRANVAVYSISAGTTSYTNNSEIIYTYNGLGEVLTQTQATGDATTYTYDTTGRQTEIQQTSFAGIKWVSGVLTATTVQPDTKLYYDGLGNLTSSVQSDSLNSGTPSRTTTYTYGAGGRLATMTDADGNVRHYYYDADGRTVKVSYTRTVADGSATLTEADGTQYDALGRAVLQGVATYNSGSNTWTYGDTQQTQYDVYGDVSAKGVNGMWQQQYFYDNAGRVWASTANGGSIELYLYDAAGNQTLTIASNGAALYSGTWSALTTAQALSWLTNGNAQAIGTYTGATTAGMTVNITTYDARNMATSTIMPQAQIAYSGSSYTTTTITNSKTYNAFGEIASQTDANGNATSFTYSTLGKVLVETLPSVSYTKNANGVAGTVATASPVITNDYDISGRVIGIQDADGNLNTQSLLTNTGYQSNAAVALNQTHADTGVVYDLYDVFGDLAKTTDALGNVTSYTYDSMGRMLTQVNPTVTHGTPGNNTGSDMTLTNDYAYDELGQRTQEWNSQLGSSYKDYTFYDLQGRITETKDFLGYTTSDVYTWSATAATTGLGTFGGWSDATTNSSGLTETITQDYFGRTVYKSDYGTGYFNHVFAYTFDLAGRLVSSVNNLGIAGNIDYTYYNTGQLKSVDDLYVTPETWTVHTNTNNGHIVHHYHDTTSLVSTYNYDANGNRTTEATVESLYNSRYSTTTSTTYESATATWDALNRMATLTETGADGNSSGGSDTITVSWGYDLNSNVIERDATYYALNNNGAVSSTQTTQDDWYEYDAMNRFTMTQGTLYGTRGSGTLYIAETGTQITYDLDGNRHSATHINETTTHTFGTHYTYQEQMEVYTYTPTGLIAQVNQVNGTASSPFSSQQAANYAPSAPSGSGFVLAAYDYDTIGRLTTYTEYNTGGSGAAVYSTVSTYDADSHLATQDISDVRSDGTWDWNTTYGYGALQWNGTQWVSTGTYQGGQVTSELTTVTKNGTSQPTTYTAYAFAWWDTAEQSITYYTPDNSHKSTVYNSYFNYDNNDLMTSAGINDGTPRNIAYQVNASGEIMTMDTSTTNSPHARYFYFDGIQQGEVTNNGTTNIDYVQSIKQNTTKPGTGYFTNGATTPTSYANFGSSYDPINGLSVEGTSTTYTVQSGDTLQSIAQAVWGDSNFWYLIADANGLTSDSTLSAGETVFIPNKVANNQNTASTYTVYDPNQAEGNTSPTHPPRPTNNSNGCGVMGMVIMAIVAVVAAVFTAGAALAVIAPEVFGSIGAGMGAVMGGTAFGALTTATTITTACGAIAAIPAAMTATAAAATLIGVGAVAGAVGSMVSQGVGLAIGAQSKFNWGAVGMAAIAGGVTAGVGAEGGIFGTGASAMLGNTGSLFGNAVLNGIGSNLLTQGLEMGTGLESKFDWIGVAGAAVTSGADEQLPGSSLTNAEIGAIGGMAGVISSAALRSVTTGTDFGDNIMRYLPNEIGQTIGNIVAADAATPDDGLSSDNAAYAAQNSQVQPSPIDTSLVVNLNSLPESMPSVSYDDGAEANNVGGANNIISTSQNGGGGSGFVQYNSLVPQDAFAPQLAQMQVGIDAVLDPYGATAAAATGNFSNDQINGYLAENAHFDVQQNAWLNADNSPAPEVVVVTASPNPVSYASSDGTSALLGFAQWVGSQVGGPDKKQQNLRTGQAMVVAGTAMTILGGVFKALAPVAVVGGGGPEEPLGDAAAGGMYWVGNKAQEMGGGVAGAGALILAANGTLREGINEVIEYPIDLGLHAVGIPEPVPELLDQAVDEGLNGLENLLNIPQDKPSPPPSNDPLVH